MGLVVRIWTVAAIFRRVEVSLSKLGRSCWAKYFKKEEYNVGNKTFNKLVSEINLIGTCLCHNGRDFVSLICNVSEDVVNFSCSENRVRIH